MKQMSNALYFVFSKRTLKINPGRCVVEGHLTLRKAYRYCLLKKHADTNSWSCTVVGCITLDNYSHCYFLKNELRKTLQVL